MFFIIIVTTICIAYNGRHDRGEQTRLDLRDFPLCARIIRIEADFTGHRRHGMRRPTIEGGSAAESSDPPARHLGIMDRPARPADNDLACIALVTLEIVKLPEFGECAIEDH